MSRHHQRAPSRAWRRLRAAILERDDYRCKCGRTATKVHHVVPAGRGGAYWDPANLFDIKVNGIDELLAQLERAQRVVTDEVAVGLGRAAGAVAEETKTDTPVRSGRAKAGLKGLDGEVTSTGAEARIVSTGTPSAYFVADEQAILEHDVEEAAVKETAAAMERALKRVFR